MKYVVCILLCWLVGCQNSPSNFEQWMKPSGRLKVVSTTAIIDDLVAQIGGEKIDHLPLIHKTMDPHSYELVKGDDEKLAFASIIFYNGLGLEHGASLCYRIKRHPKSVALGESIWEQNPSAILVEQGQVDPHIWLDVSLWALAIDPIAQALGESDPQNRAYYLKQAQETKIRLLALDASIEKKLETIPQEKRYLVSSHDAFNYFARRYLGKGDLSWKTRFCAPEGLAPDGQLSYRDIRMVVDYLEEHRVEVMFSEANVSQDSLKKIASVCTEKKKKITIAKTPLYSDTLGDATYKEMMEHNTNTLYAAWIH